MRRLAAIDWLLLGISLPILLFGLVMSVVHGVRGDFVVPTFWATSAADQQSYPVVGRIWSRPSGETSPLAVGDRLVRLEESDLRGVSNAGFMLRWSQAAQAGARSLLLTIDRGSVRSDVRVLLVPGYGPVGITWWAPLPFIAGSVVTALLLLVRGAHWHLARRYYVASLLLVLSIGPYFAAPTAPRAELITDVLVLPLACGLFLWNLNEFLPGLRLWGPGQRALASALALLLSVSFAADFWLPDVGLAAISWGAAPLALTGFSIASLVALTRVYQRADPLGRRQIKWVVYGFYVGLSPLGLFCGVLSLGVAPEWISALFAVATIAAVAVPLGFLVAIAFYQFLDIDRLFSATLSYSILTVLALAVVLGVMPAASRAASDVLGLDPVAGQLLVSLGLAAVLVPAHRRLRPQIDRLFFKERYAIERGVEGLLHELAGCDGPEALFRLTGGRVDALVRPDACVIYTRAGDAYVPACVRGRAVPLAFEAGSPLIASLESLTRPLVAERWAGGRDLVGLGPFDRAALETLGVAVILPIRRGDTLVAFLCLGGKRSGDVYTTTDLALLGSVAHAISRELLRFDDAELVREARAMQEALRRYVPAPVAAQLGGRTSPVAGERDVSVLFVDIRGYTTYAEGRKAEDVFTTTNRFTEAVSGVVRAQGGTLVEFSGDGILAVFGAPEPLAQKERAAVEAGRDLIAAVGSLDVDGGRSLSVGVGIASGPAYVGDVQAVDHRIWTVIGNTPNLAARLQTLTRDLDAAMAIDAATWQRAGYVAADFLRHERVAIRGRTEPEDVYLLPLFHRAAATG